MIIFIERTITTLRLLNYSEGNLHDLFVAMKVNVNHSITRLDLSRSKLPDNVVDALGVAIVAMPHGLLELNLTDCKIRFWCFILLIFG